jgi:DNA helicase-2/ATP-dependent DNA helicase PcrA
MAEFRGFGPPGTGKTSRLATRDIPRAVDKYGPDAVMVVSFTRAAALEIATKKSRDTGQTIPLPPENVGTLHSICFRGFKQPELMIQHTARWNEMYPQYAMASQGKIDVEGAIDDQFSGSFGDKLLNLYNIFRAKMVNPKAYPKQVSMFVKKWEAYKKQHRVFDFTDLIERGIKELPRAPGDPQVLFLDEVQDFSQLELTLARSWGVMCEWMVMVGDDDQTIYGFTGADPKAFLNPPVDDDHKFILKKSYRVPSEILKRSMRLIRQVQFREPKEYEPRDGDPGQVVESMEAWKNPEEIIDEATSLMRQGKSVMILASCAYMIDPVKRALKQRGAPFGNRYRIKRGDWNPLAGGTKKVTARDILVRFTDMDFEDPYWSVPDLLDWAKNLKVGPHGLLPRRGNKAITKLKAAVAEGADGLHTSRNVLSQVLSPAAISPALSRNVDWLVENLKPAKQKSVAYPVKVLRNNGAEYLKGPPLITIGTIHSVKGGEADVVFLYPDISIKAEEEAASNPDKRDGLRRLFYVGMTRAREKLVIMSPNVNPKHVVKATFMEF